MKNFREFFPVHVLWRRVVEVLCGNNEGRKKYSMQRARDTSRHLGKIFLQAPKIDKCCEEGGDLHARCLDNAGDKLLKWDETWSVCELTRVCLARRIRGGGERTTCRGRHRRRIFSEGNDAARLTGEIDDHLSCNRLLNEADELRVVEGGGNEREGVSPIHDERERVELIELIE